MWLLPVLALGVVRAVAGVSNGKPIGYLLLLMAVTALVALVLAVQSPDRLTRAGRRVLDRIRADNRHLRPGLSPSMSAYGMTAAATAVALYGTASMWRTDPGFASAAGAPTATTGSSGGGSSGYSGDSGSSGGSGCGGGGGGGGCGG